MFLSLALTCFFGFFGFVLYLLRHSNQPLHSAAFCLGYLLIWPVLLIQYLGGSNPMHFHASFDPVKALSWIGLWIYYYLVIVLCERWIRKG